MIDPISDRSIEGEINGSKDDATSFMTLKVKEDQSKVQREVNELMNFSDSRSQIHYIPIYEVNINTSAEALETGCSRCVGQEESESQRYHTEVDQVINDFI